MRCATTLINELIQLVCMCLCYVSWCNSCTTYVSISKKDYNGQLNGKHV